MARALRHAGLSAEDQRTGDDARALADDTRLAVLRAVVDADHPLTVSELTEQFDLHHTAIRLHLARLVEAGYLHQSTLPPRGRGRPRLAYAPSGKAEGGVGSSYRELARLLAESVRTGASPRVTGQREGQRVAAAAAADADAVNVIVGEAGRLGFEPQPEPVGMAPGRLDVVLHHCPFQDVAAQDPAVVCDLHLGLAEGIAGELGGVDVVGMEVHDPYRAGCRLHLQRLDGLTPAP